MRPTLDRYPLGGKLLIADERCADAAFPASLVAVHLEHGHAAPAGQMDGLALPDVRDRVRVASSQPGGVNDAEAESRSRFVDNARIGQDSEAANLKRLGRAHYPGRLWV